MRYETQSDREHEARIALAVSGVWGVPALRLPALSVADYLLCATSREPPDVISLLEIKRRSSAHDTYDTFMLSQTKVRRLLDVGQLLVIESLVVIEFSDGVYYTTADAIAGANDVRIGGRHDRGDEGVEAMCHIHHSALGEI